MSGREESTRGGPPCSDLMSERLIPYVQRRLGAAEREALERHVASCPACAERLEVLAGLRDAAREEGAALAGHVPALELVLYSGSAERLPAGRQAAIEKHLASCRECTEDLAVLRAADRELAETEPEAPPPAARIAAADPASPARGRESFLAPLWGLLRRNPAPAYVALALLLLPATVGIRAMLADGAAAHRRGWIRMVGAPRQLGAEVERGGGAARRFAIPGTGELSFLVTLPETSGPLRRDAEIRDAAGRALWRQEGISSLDRSGTYLLVVERAALPPGPYTLVLIDVAPFVGEERGSASFPFELVGSR